MNMLTTLERTAAILASVSAIIAASGVAWRFERRARRLITRVVGDDDTPSILARLDDIQSQLRPNGGSSLRDALDTVIRQQADQGALLAAHMARPHPEV